MKDYKPYLLITVVVLLTYGPLSRANYGFGDDYNLLPHTEPLGFLHLTDGRIIYALAQDYIHRPINHISQFGYLRFVGSIGLALIAILLFRQLKRLFVHKAERVALAIAIVTLPCLQTYVGQAILWLAILSGFAVLAAAALTFRATRESSSKRSSLRDCLFAMLIMLCTVLTYQPMLSMYWVLVVVYLLDDRFYSSAEYRKRIVKTIAMGVFYFVACLVVFKLSFLLHDQVPKSRVQFTHQPFVKLYWFFRIQFPLALNFWHLFDSSKRILTMGIAAAMSLFILAGYVTSWRLRFVNQAESAANQSSDRTIFVYRAALLFGVLLLTHVHWLIIGIVPQSYRMIGPLGVATFILVYWGFVQLTRLVVSVERQDNLRLVASVSIAILGIASCQHTSEKYWITPQTVGYRYMLMTLKDQAIEDTKHVHLIQQTTDESFIEEWFVESFGRPASERAWTIESMVRSAIRDSGIPNKIESVTFGTAAKPVPATDNTLVIDMRKLKLMRLR